MTTFGRCVHQNGKTCNGEAVCDEAALVLLIFLVEKQSVEEPLVDTHQTARARSESESTHHAVSRAFDSAPADQGRDADDRCSGLAHRTSHAGQGENRTDADEGIAGRDQDQIGTRDGFQNTGGGFRGTNSGVSDFQHVAAGPVAHEVLLKCEFSLGCVDDGPHTVVAHGPDSHGNPEGFPLAASDLGQRLAALERRCAKEVRGQILIAESEPDVLPEGREGVHGIEAVPTKSPTLRAVDLAGERIEQGVHVG